MNDGKKREPRIRLRKGKYNALLCPECQIMIEADFVNEIGHVRLVCGHVRPALLPSKGISLEDMWLNQTAFDRLFPWSPADFGGRKRDLSDVIADISPDELEAQARREKWSYER
ncbi:MAG TPA: hypothetical protein VHZ09_19320 [Acidobacteriaceae bacterium]|jgi:hypothetical protein|nr:hypothetical protein [Acidobacteriaceae bacterium]